MTFACIPPELLEKIAHHLDTPSALAFIQIDRHVNQAFKKNKRFWMTVAKYIGIEATDDDSVDDIKNRFCDWKAGESLFNIID